MPTIDLSLAAAIAIIFGAAVVRGFSGFGFSLLAISGLTLLYPLTTVIVSVLLMELAASINLLPSVWRDIHWRSLLPLLAGAAAGTPLGVWCLGNTPAAPMQIALGLFILVAVWLLWIGYSLKHMPGLASTLAAGAVSGLSNGAFGIGGPPVILFYFASPAGAAVGRASLTAFFFALDIIGIANLYQQSLVTQDAMVRALWFAPALLSGVWVGARSFASVDPEKFRKAVLVLLAVMAFALIAKATL